MKRFCLVARVLFEYLTGKLKISLGSLICALDHCEFSFCKECSSRKDLMNLCIGNVEMSFLVYCKAIASFCSESKQNLMFFKKFFKTNF